MNKIEAVQQSKKDLTLTDGAAELELFHVHYSQGSGGNQMKHLQGNEETFKNEKRSIVRIMNEDTICLWLVVTLRNPLIKILQSTLPGRKNGSELHVETSFLKSRETKPWS